jgi:hypothetical protein
VFFLLNLTGKNGSFKYAYRTKEELLLANKELLGSRREDLRVLLAADLTKYERELSSRDLAFHRNRI